MLKQKSFGISLLVYSIIAWLASGALSLERLALYKDPTHVASCDFGLFVSCSSIMKTEQAGLFGFPNPFLGIVGFAITGTIAVFMVMTARLDKNFFPKWYMACFQIGVTIAFALVCFFWYTSVIKIMILCPWCMVVWSMVVPMFLHTTFLNAANGLFGGKLTQIGRKLIDWIWVAVISVYVVIIASILIRFQEYIF